MWIVTIRKKYENIEFEFEILQDATNFIGEAAYRSKTPCEITFRYEEGAESEI